MATADDWGLTDRGFRRPTYAEILDALEFKARELFGSKANLTVRSPLGVFLRIFAWGLNLLFSTIEDVYNSRFIDTAIGASLYNLGRAIGLRLLSAQKAVGYLQITGTDGMTVPVGWLAATTAGAQYVVVSERVIEDGAATVPAAAMLAGPDGNTAAGTITTIVNPIEGISAVTNPKAFDGGRNTETDPEYRARYYESVDIGGGVNVDSISAALLQAGAMSAVGYENVTDAPDEDGVPGHAFEMVVYGLLDGEVATIIFKLKAAGVQTHGNTTTAVIAANGRVFDINFSRPSTVLIYIRISSLKTDSKAFPADGLDRIKQALLNYVGGNVRGGLTIGVDVVFNRLYAPVFTVPGVIDFDLAICSDGANYGTANIPITSRQKAVVEEGTVTFA